jgi:dihydroflavonol-4-reductase
LVDVRDVAKGHLLAAEHGRSGERYILGAENLTLQEIFGRLERISGIQSPRLRIPYAAAYGVAIVNAGWARLTGKPPRAPLDGVKMARKKMFVSHRKASEKLGYVPGGVDDALRRAVDWFQANGYC